MFLFAYFFFKPQNLKNIVTYKNVYKSQQNYLNTGKHRVQLLSQMLQVLEIEKKYKMWKCN